ncbi:MAG TPA: hypothetical protein VIE67_14340 [Rudaea sp.]|uniref:hypothetical protein n=1 Tax=Rudaea sp. TaxID=2136325 RepID=UPI002F93A50D
MPTVSVATRGPAAEGLKRIVSVRLLPVPIDTGSTGAPMIEKSLAFAPLIASDASRH